MAAHSRSRHVAIGGNMMTMHSPLDPLFYMHHGHLDYIWSKAQVQWALKNKSQVGSLNTDGSRSSFNTALPIYKNVFNDVLNLDNLCVQYVPAGTPNPITPTTSSSSSAASQSSSASPSSSSASASPSSSSAAASPSSSSVAASQSASASASQSSPASSSSPTVSPSSSSSAIKVSSQTSSASASSSASSAASSPSSAPSVTSSPAASATSSTTASGSSSQGTASSTTASGPVETYEVPRPPTYVPITSCPPQLPSDWAAMNRLNASRCEQIVQDCQQVVAAVAAGKQYPPIPAYSPSTYSSAVSNALPANMTVNPPAQPSYAVYSSASGSSSLITLSLAV
ncbi:hypothetical protein HDU91_007469, partial [Kappamyces sp. JEL0680]